MSKLIVETEMNGIPNCCGLCDPLFAAVCALKHDQTIDEMMLRVGRPSWCPIVGVLPEQHGDLIDRDALLGTCIYYYINPNKSAVDADNIQDMPVIIAAERKDDE